MFCSVLLLYLEKGKKSSEEKEQTKTSKRHIVIPSQGQGALTQRTQRRGAPPQRAEGHRVCRDRIKARVETPDLMASEGTPERQLGEHRAEMALDGQNGQSRHNNDTIIKNERKLQTVERCGDFVCFLLLLLELSQE